MGLVAEAAKRPTAAPKPGAAAPTGQGSADSMSPKAVMAAMHVNPQQQEQLQRIVAAGMKVMFSQQTHQLMLDSMQGEGPVEQKLAQGVVGLMGMLWSESKGSIPPSLIIPAATVLMAEAADFMNQAGQPVTPEQFGAATEMMIDLLLKQGGVDSNKLAAAADGGGGAPAAGMPQQGAPA